MAPETAAATNEAQDLGQNLVADDCDDANSISSSLATDTTSLHSSVFNYEYDNGRRYHAYRSGKYLLPNDETEQDRLDMVHHAWRLFLNGKLTLVDLDSSKKLKVLDVGCGTGIWCIDFGDEYQDAEVFGVDLSAIQPKWVPPNVHFLVDDLEDEWTFPKDHFDYIHYRTMAGSLRDWKKIIEQSLAHLKPGGYIEIQDFDLSMLYSDDGTLKPDSATVEYYNQLWGAYKKLGIATDIDTYPDLCAFAGFTDVKVSNSKFPLGPWAKSPKAKELGLWTREIAKSGIESYALKMFTSVLGWETEKANELIERAVKEATNQKIHSYWRTINVIARKPL